MNQSIIPATLPAAAELVRQSTDIAGHQKIMRRVIVDERGCWNWQGARNNRGYGRTSLDGREIYTHRAMYVLCVGEIPNGFELDHLCENPACCNPAHLEAVTHAENMRRGAHKIREGMAKIAPTHCRRGHAYEGENLYVHRNKRYCRTCTRWHSAKWKEANK